MQERNTMKSRAALALFALISVLFSYSGAYALPLPEKSGKMTLSGAWRLVVVQPLRSPLAYKNFYQPGFDERGMDDIDVPSHWELRGFEKARYKFPSRSTGYYRKSFNAPPVAQGERVMLHFEGVLYGAEVWLNGVKLGEHLGGFTGFEFDVTEVIKSGDENLLAVKVEKAKAMAHGFDCSDAWALSGIFRDVYIYKVPVVHLADIKIETDLDEQYIDAVLSVKFAVKNLLGYGALAKVNLTLVDPDGSQVASVIELLEAENVEVNLGEIEMSVKNPAKWSSESPKLYTLLVTVESDGYKSTTSHVVGFREVEVRDGLFLINGAPVKLRGVNRHATSIVNGRALTREQMIKDLDLMEMANINTVRTSHYPPDPEFLDLCDRRGVYVLDEAPFNFSSELMYIPWYHPLIENRVAETIARDKNHPSVIIWSLGNENPWTTAHPKAVKLAHALDDTRPVVVPRTGYESGKNGGNISYTVDIETPHYPDPTRFRKIIEAQKNDQKPRPIILTEYLHSLGRHYWTREMWDIMMEEPLAAGGCTWDWADQGILRPVGDERVYKVGDDIPYSKTDTLIANNYYDEDHIVDSFGIMGSDGLVNSDRTPQPEYYEIKKIYTPIYIADETISVEPGQPGVTINVQNRYDFTSLDTARMEWTVYADGDPVDSGAMRYPPVKPGESAAIFIDATVPYNMEPGLTYQLGIESYNQKGLHIDSHRIMLTALGTAADYNLPSDYRTESSIAEDGDRIVVSSGAFSISFDRETGDIVSLSSNGEQRSFNGPKLNAWRPLHLVETAQPSYAYYAADKNTAAPWRIRGAATSGIIADLKAMSQVSGDISVESRAPGKVVLVSNSTYEVPHRGTFEMQRRYEVYGSGIIRIAYDIEPKIGSSRLLSLGVRFDLPQGYDRMEIFGVGPDAYPGTIRNSEISMLKKMVMTPDDQYFTSNKVDVRWVKMLGGPVPIMLKGAPGLLGSVRAESTETGASIYVSPWVKQPGKKHRNPGDDLEVLVSNGDVFTGQLHIIISPQ
jgi:beta-galactosidase